MAPRYVRIRLPQIPAGLGANLAGLVGLVMVAVCVGGLTGNWWWSGLIGGGMLVALSWMAGTPDPVEQPVEVEDDDTADDEVIGGVPVAGLRAVKSG